MPNETLPPTLREYKDGELQYTLSGAPLRPLSDLYHHLLRGSWRKLIGFALAVYLGMNLIFAWLYFLGGDCIAGTTPGSFWEMYWFSVQTFSTIGYGARHPTTTYAHIIVVVESFVALSSVALITALMFSKFARPIARVEFSKRAVVNLRNGFPSLQIRLANERHNQIYDGHLQIGVLVEETSQEGQTMRRFYDLKLEREHVPMFVMTWTAFHPIDESSPLHGLCPENVHTRVLMILAIFSGVDDTYAQTVHARHMFMPEEVVFDAEFEDIIERPGNGRVFLNLENLHKEKPQRENTAPLSNS